MIELVFSESTAGALKCAKSKKPGDKMQVSVSETGEMPKQQGNVLQQRIWTGAALEGSSKDVFPLTLALDIGELSDKIDDRLFVLQKLFGRYEGVVEELAASNRRTLSRLTEAKNTHEAVRIWVSNCDPAELCGLYCICDLFRNAEIPLSVVFTPTVHETADTITQYRGTGGIPPESFGSLAISAKQISNLLKRFYADLWRELVRENAPLRAIINEKVMSVPEDFYDFLLRTNMPAGRFISAQVLGKALIQMPGVGDTWLYLRLQEMIKTGLLEEISPPGEDYPYSSVLCLK